MMLLSDAIRESRQRRGWSQMELAAEAQSTPSQVSRHENGQARPRAGRRLQRLYL